MMRSVVKALRWALLAAVVLGAAALGGTWWLMRSGPGQDWLRAQVHAALGPSVRFAAVHVALWPPPLAVALHDVELLGADGQPIVRAHHLLGRVRLRALVEGPPLLERIEVEQFEVTVTRAADGSIAFAARGDGGATTTLPASLDAQCPTVALRDGRILLRDASDADAPPVQIDDVAAQLTPTRPGARLALRGRSAQIGSVDATLTLSSLGGIATAPFAAEVHARDAAAATIGAWMPRGGGVEMVGRAELTARLSGRPTAGAVDATVTLHSGEIAWRDTLEAAAPITMTVDGTWSAGGLTAANGTARVARLTAEGVSGTEVAAEYAATSTALTLRDLRWQALGGAWRQAGTLQLSDQAVLDGEVVAENVDGSGLAAELAHLFGAAVAPLHLDGRLRLRAAVKGTVGESLAGSLALELEQGAAGWHKARATAPLALTADVTLAGAEPTVQNGRLRAAAVGDHDLSAAAVEASFSLEDKTLQVASLQARAFDGDLTASGTLPLDGGAPTVTLRAVGINAAHIARALLTGDKEEAGTAGDVDVTASLRGGRGTLSLTLASPTLTLGAVQVSRPATASGDVTWSGGTTRVSGGRAQLSRVRAENTNLGDVRASFSTSGTGQLRLAPLTARAFNGQWTIDATLSREAIDGTVRAAAIDLGALLAALDEGPRALRATATLDLTVHRPRDGATNAAVALQLSRGTFLFDDLVVNAPARGTATVRVDGERWSVSDMVANAASARFAFLQGSDASARLDFDPDQIRFGDLRFTAASAPWTCSGTVTLADPPRLDGRIAVTRADPDGVMAMLGVTAPTLDPNGLDLDLQARATIDSDWQRSVQGSGSMALRGGTLTSTALLRAMVAAVVPSRQLREGGLPNRLNSLTQTFTLTDGVARTNDLAVSTDDYGMTAAGTIGLDGRLALQGQVTLTPNGIKKMFALSSVPIPGSGMLSLPTVPARIDGTLADPRIHPEAAALAGSTARWFADALLATPRRLGETVVRPFEMLFDSMRRATPTPR